MGVISVYLFWVESLVPRALVLSTAHHERPFSGSFVNTVDHYLGIRDQLVGEARVIRQYCSYMASWS